MVKGITYILNNDPAFQAKVGKNRRDTKYKVYPVACTSPEAWPYSVVIQTGKQPMECKGDVPSSFIYTYDVYSFHANYDDVEEINNAVIEALSQPNGGTYNNVTFQEIRFTNETEGYDGEYRLYIKTSTFTAWVDEN